MMDDLISRQAAIDIVQHECGEWKGLAREIVKQFNGMPAVDLSDYCDKLWKIAYKHGKRDAQQAPEPMPGLYVVGFNDGYEAGEEDAQQDIVYCKDCRWWGVRNKCGHRDAMIIAPVNGFCSYGERKSDG